MRPQTDSLAAARELELSTADDETWRVFADELQQRGDPRGELMALQYSVGNTVEGFKVIQRHIDQHRDSLLGPLDDVRSQLKLSWKRGYLDEVRLHCDADDDAQRPIAEVLPALLAHESARFLRSLKLGWPAPDDAASYDAVLDVLLEQKWPSFLRELLVGDFTATEGEMPDLRGLSRLVRSRHFASLSSFSVRARLTEVGQLASTTLQTLSIASDQFLPETFETLWAAKLPALRSFIIDACFNYDLDPEALEPVLSGTVFPTLTGFGLRGLEYEAVETIAAASRLPQWKTVDLSLNALQDGHVADLLELAPRFAHLDQLVLRQNAFGAKSVKQLTARLPNCDVRHQKAAPPRRRSSRYDDVQE